MSYITALCVQGIPMLSPLIFMLSLYSHSRILTFTRNVLLGVACYFPRNELFTYECVGSQSFISLPSFMIFSAVVREIRELNQNKKEEEKKKNSEIGYFQFKTFLGI